MGDDDAVSIPIFAAAVTKDEFPVTIFEMSSALKDAEAVNTSPASISWKCFLCLFFGDHGVRPVPTHGFIFAAASAALACLIRLCSTP